MVAYTVTNVENFFHCHPEGCGQGPQRQVCSGTSTCAWLPLQCGCGRSHGKLQHDGRICEWINEHLRRPRLEYVLVVEIARDSNIINAG